MCFELGQRYISAPKRLRLRKCTVFFAQRFQEKNYIMSFKHIQLHDVSARVDGTAYFINLNKSESVKYRIGCFEIGDDNSIMMTLR